MTTWGHYGPWQLWEGCRSLYTGDTSPMRRLDRMAERGLPVGPGTRYMGGLRRDHAIRLKNQGLVTLDYDEHGNPIRAYVCQLSLSF